MSTTIANKKFGLTSNQLKIIAMISMVIDHIGVYLFPHVYSVDGIDILRILGRIAFPIYALCIAEGCRYTKNKAKYLGLIAAMAVVFQIVFFVFMNSLYQGILVTFSLSIITIYAIDSFIKNKSVLKRILMALIVAIVLFAVYGLPTLIKGFVIDYGIWGVSLPVILYFANNKKLRLALLIIFIGGWGFYSAFKWWPLLSIPFIALYNGERGKAKMKYFFYIFYPLHLVIIYGIGILMVLLR